MSAATMKISMRRRMVPERIGESQKTGTETRHYRGLRGSIRIRTKKSAFIGSAISASSAVNSDRRLRLQTGFTEDNKVNEVTAAEKESPSLPSFPSVRIFPAFLLSCLGIETGFTELTRCRSFLLS
jgi:hypothetical protein